MGLDATNTPQVLLVDPDGTLHVNVAAIVPAAVDVTDRAARLLGIIYGDVGQLLQRPATRDLLVQLRSAGVEIDPRARTWVLGALDVPDISDRWARQLGMVDIQRYLGVACGPLNPIDVTAVIAGVVDVSDRWARQLGQIDLARVLGVALSAANPVIAGIFDALGNRMPSMDAVARAGFVDVIDRAARLLGIIYGDVGQVHQVAPADALAPGTALSVAGFNFIFNGVTWDMVREGASPGSILTDPADRVARQLGLVRLTDYTNDGAVFPHDGSIPVSPAKITVQSFDSLVGAVAEGAAINLALNTNHRGAGANSVEFDKAAGNILAGVSYAIAALDLSRYSTHSQVDFYIYLPTPVGGNVVQVYCALGTDNANLFYWAIPIADLTLDAWNHVMLTMMDISGVLGVGANLSAVTWAAIYVQTNVVGATITNILVDQLEVKRAFEVNIIQDLPTLYDGLTPMHLVRAGTFQYIYDPVAGDWNRLREGSTIGSLSVDITDRWTRQLGLIDISRVLGVALSAANPVIVGLLDAAGNRMPSMDVAARPGFVDPIDRWARQLGLIDISRVLGVALSAANPVITGIYDAAGNRMPAMDAAARPGFQDVIDRAARLLGIVYGESAQLQQLTPADALIPNLSLEATSFKMLWDPVAGDWNRAIETPTQQGVQQVEDLGTHTNPERYIQTNKFSSVPIDRAGGVATLLYGLASPAAHRRTAGLSTTVWWIYFYNHSGGAATVWLEAPLATVMSGTVQLADNQGVMLQVKPLDIGDLDIYVNASVNNVQAQIGGVEV